MLRRTPGHGAGQRTVEGPGIAVVSGEDRHVPVPESGADSRLRALLGKRVRRADHAALVRVGEIRPRVDEIGREASDPLARFRNRRIAVDQHIVDQPIRGHRRDRDGDSEKNYCCKHP